MRNFLHGAQFRAIPRAIPAPQPEPIQNMIKPKYLPYAGLANRESQTPESILETALAAGKGTIREGLEGLGAYRPDLLADEIISAIEAACPPVNREYLGSKPGSPPGYGQNHLLSGGGEGRLGEIAVRVRTWNNGSQWASGWDSRTFWEAKREGEWIPFYRNEWEDGQRATGWRKDRK